MHIYNRLLYVYTDLVYYAYMYIHIAPLICTTAAVIRSTGGIRMIIRAPVHLHSQCGCGFCPRSCNWTILVDVQSPDCAPSGISGLGILYVLVTAITDCHTSCYAGAAGPSDCIHPTCIVVDDHDRFTDGLCDNLLIAVCVRLNNCVLL